MTDKSLFEGEFNMGAPHYTPVDQIQPNSWSEPPIEEFLVRGPKYLEQNRKNAVEFKQQSAPPLYRCINLNAFLAPVNLSHSAEKVGELRRFLETHPDDEYVEGGLPKYLIFCFMFKSIFSSDYTLVQQVFKRQGPGAGQDAVLERTMKRFLEGDDKYKSDRLKFMCHVVEAPGAILGTVRGLGGERPVLIGKKLTTHYFRGKNYLEVNMDVSSSMIASTLNSTILAASGASILDYSWLLEAQDHDELPERVLVKIRSFYCDPKQLYVNLDKNGERKE